jgi:hypothetical protein
MIDAMQAVKDAVYAAVSAVNANTKPNYPLTLFQQDTPIPLPLTVYEVYLSNGMNMPASQEVRRWDVEVRLDHFGTSRAQVSTVAQPALAAMLGILPRCTTDEESNLPNGLVRRSQRFTGLYDTGDNRIYAR